MLTLQGLGTAQAKSVNKISRHQQLAKMSTTDCYYIRMCPLTPSKEPLTPSMEALIPASTPDSIYRPFTPPPPPSTEHPPLDPISKASTNLQSIHP
jgi:hypothetical protein